MSIGNELALALDPVLLARKTGIDPDPWQIDVLRSPATRTLLNCCRQSGKSTVSGVVAVHRAVYRPSTLVLLLSPTLRQSQELFRKCLDVYRTLGRPVPADSENKLSLELKNGSRIVSLPGTESTTRGFSAVDLIVIDEASRVDDDLYYSVRPMLAVSGGSLIALSTPWGKRGWWSTAWHGSEAWQRVKIPAQDCPRIPPAFLEEERRNLGEWWFSQEYLCEFRESEDSVFSLDDIDAALDDNVIPLWRTA